MGKYMEQQEALKVWALVFVCFYIHRLASAGRIEIYKKISPSSRGVWGYLLQIIYFAGI